MTKLLAIRPEPGLSNTIHAAQAMGLDMVGIPLFDIRSLQWDCPDPASFDALLIGSANAILHGGQQLDQLKDKPVYAVGETTAATARDAGFDIAAVGTGGLQNVLDAVPVPLHMLRIAGSEHVPLTPPQGVSIQTVIAYESIALSLGNSTIEALGKQPIVLLHSAAAAAHFASECERLHLNRSDITLAVLGPRIAKAAGAGWHAVHVSPHPSDSALLEMIRDMCV